MHSLIKRLFAVCWQRAGLGCRTSALHTGAVGAPCVTLYACPQYLPLITLYQLCGSWTQIESALLQREVPGIPLTASPPLSHCWLPPCGTKPGWYPLAKHQSLFLPSSHQTSPSASAAAQPHCLSAPAASNKNSLCSHLMSQF